MNNGSLDDVGDMVVFTTIAETGSLTKAAVRLGLSKASVSSRLSRLERRLEVPLFVRSTRALSLTTAGRTLLDGARRGLSELGEGLDAVRELTSEPSGLLRVTTPTAIGRQLIGPHVADFLRQHPKISLELHMSDDIMSLATGGFDVAIRHTAAPPDTYLVWPLRNVTWHLVAAPRYLDEHGTPMEPGDLIRHQCLFYFRGDEATTWSFVRNGRTRSVTVRGRYRANNSELLREAVLGGAGIGLLPDFSCLPEIGSSGLVPVLPDYEVRGTFADQIIATRPWTARVPRNVRAFADYFRARLARTDLREMRMSAPRAPMADEA